jgi:hypothetical protein
MAPQASWPSSMPLGLQHHGLGFRAGVILFVRPIDKSARFGLIGKILLTFFQAVSNIFPMGRKNRKKHVNM